MTPVSSSRPARRSATRAATVCAHAPSITRSERLEPRVLLAVFTVTTTTADDGVRILQRDGGGR